MLPCARIEHGEFFRNRASERELCQDFPGDKILIDGLHSMQVHLWSNGLNIDIPVVKVMNAAHYLAAYMFRTTCSGDQTEYDTLAYCSVGHDRRLMLISIIVLAAMLQRTEGLRAGQCRDILIENRNEDFEEGVTLYERFLRSAEKRFAEEDFLIDLPAVMEQMKEKDEIIYQQAQQIQQLQYTITTMEEKSNNTQIIGTQYKQDNNQGTIYNAPVTIQYITNPAEQNTSEPQQAYSVQEEPSDSIDSIIFTKKAKQEKKEASIIEALQNSIQGRKDKTRAFVRELQSWQKEAYIDAHYNAQVMYDELAKIIPLPFGYEVFKKHYNNTRY